MKTHAEVHEEVERICHGTRLLTFMVTTNSFRNEDGTVAVEWAVCISSGREPQFYFRARDPDELVNRVRAGVELRRPYFAINPGALDVLRGMPPRDTALSDPARRDGEEIERPVEGPR